LFEVWLGDDDDNSHHRKTIECIKQLSDQGTPVFIQHGNRDFLIGNQFETMSGCTLLTDPYIIELYGQKVMLMHGDLLCSDDVEYQSFRQQVRNPEWQNHILQLPLSRRRELAKELREKSRQQTQGKTEEIMDVTQSTVKRYMLDNNVSILIHGHTHRPKIHEWKHDGNTATRIVLGDWYSQGSVLRWNKKGYQLESLPRAESN
jgi:UDP-2,3-diacylglucosamine hydrolase